MSFVAVLFFSWAQPATGLPPSPTLRFLTFLSLERSTHALQLAGLFARRSGFQKQ